MTGQDVAGGVTGQPFGTARRRRDAVPRPRCTEPERPAVSVIIPAKNEQAQITRVLARTLAAVSAPCEVLVVVDTPEDPTAAVTRDVAAAGGGPLRCLVNTYGAGPANAIRYGIDHAMGDIAVVTMADGSDDVRQIDELVTLVRRGAVVAAASRYMSGGQRTGRPTIQSVLSRLAGTSLHLLARTGTRDATNSFKAYSVPFIREVGIESRHGFTIGIELTAKATRLHRPVAEIATVWLDRQEGESGFRLAAWLPAYLRWYAFCFGRRLRAADRREEGAAGVAMAAESK